MANVKFREKEIVMELCRRTVEQLEEKSSYYDNRMNSYEEQGIDTLSTWDEMEYNDCKRYIVAIDTIIKQLEKLI